MNKNSAGVEKIDIQDLPDELLLYIFEFISPVELLNLYSVSKRLCYLSYSDETWRRIARVYLNWDHFNQADPEWTSYPKFNQIHEAKLRKNLCKKTNLLKKWEKSFKNGLFWVRADDGEEPSWIRSMEVQGDSLFVAKNAQEIVGYNLTDLKCHAMEITATPTCMSAINASFDAKRTKLFVGSNSGTLFTMDYYYNYAQRSESHLLYAQDVKISSVRADYSRQLMQLFVGTKDIEIFNMSQTSLTSAAKIELNNPINQVTSIDCDEKNIFAAINDGTMAIYDRETLQLIKSVVAHKAYFERLRLFRNTIATSSRDETVKLWDPRDSSLNEVLKLPMPDTITVTDFRINDWNLTACTGGGSVWIWDLRFQLPVSVSQITDQDLWGIAATDQMIFTGGSFPLVFAKNST